MEDEVVEEARDSWLSVLVSLGRVSEDAIKPKQIINKRKFIIEKQYPQKLLTEFASKLVEVIKLIFKLKEVVRK